MFEGQPGCETGCPEFFPIHQHVVNASVSRAHPRGVPNCSLFKEPTSLGHGRQIAVHPTRFSQMASLGRNDDSSDPPTAVKPPAILSIFLSEKNSRRPHNNLIQTATSRPSARPPGVSDHHHVSLFHPPQPRPQPQHDVRATPARAGSLRAGSPRLSAHHPQRQRPVQKSPNPRCPTPTASVPAFHDAPSRPAPLLSTKPSADHFACSGMAPPPFRVHGPHRQQ